MKTKLLAETWRHDHGEIIANTPHETLIAEVFLDNKNAKANGDLIAAAPELLAALKEEHNTWDIPEHDKETCTTCAIIAKAEGK